MLQTKEDIQKYLYNYYITTNKKPIKYDNHPFSIYTIKQLFKNWSNALLSSGVPLNKNRKVLTDCKLCNNKFYKEFKEFKKTTNDFCSRSCANKYNNTGRKMSESTKNKIRCKLKQVKFTKCKICKKQFRYYKRKRLSCGDRCLDSLVKYNNLKKKGLIVEYLTDQE